MAISFNRRQHIRFSPKAVPGLLEAWYAPYLGGVTSDSLNQVTTLADLSGRGRSLSITDATQGPLLCTDTSKGNLALNSDDLTQASWTKTSGTANSTSLFTFTAQNGIVSCAVRAVPSRVYTVRFNAKAVSGHTALTLVSTNCTVATQAITLTGTLAPFSFSFTASATINQVMVFGIKDTAASGFGQIQITNFQVIESGWDTTYIANTSTVSVPSHLGKPFLLVGRQQQVGGVFTSPAFTLNSPCSFYLLARIRYGAASGRYIFDGGSLNSGEVTLATSTTSLNAGGTLALANTALPAGFGSWCVITFVNNGANSIFQINRTTPTTGDSGVANPSGFTLGNRFSGSRTGDFDFLECIIRNGADNAETQNAFQLYLADVAGIVI